MKKNILFLGLAALALTACSDNGYDDWADAQSSAQDAAKIVSLALAPAQAIDFSTLTADSVQLFVPTVTAETGAVNTYNVVLNNEDKTASSAALKANAQGFVSTAELQSAYYALVGRRPIQRNIDLNVTSYTKINGESVKEEGTTTASLKASAPVIESKYYVTGNINGWSNTDTTYPVVNGGGDPYDDPIFTVTLPATGSDIEFKLTPESGLGGDWSKCITATTDGTEGKLTDGNAGGNLVIKNVDGAKFYRVTFDLLNQTWSYVALSFNEFFYEIGNESGWSTSHALYGANYDGKYVGYYYLNGDFKFKPNADNYEGDYEYNGEGKIADINGGSNIPDPGAGFYRINVDLVALTYSLTKVNTISVIGNGDDWNTDYDMTYNTTTGNWEWTGAISGSGIKFRVNHDWAISWGGRNSGTDYNDLTESNGKNLSVPAGKYKVTLTVNHENGACKVNFEKQ